MDVLLVVVGDLDIVRVAVLPPKADAPLIVDVNAVLPGSIPFELLQAIARRDAQVVEQLCSVDEPELPQHDPLELYGKSADPFAAE
jgi:hypothetical protein